MGTPEIESAHRCASLCEFGDNIVRCERERSHGGAHAATLDDPEVDPDFTYRVSWWPTEQKVEA